MGGAAKAALAHVDAATGSVAGGLRGAAGGVADRAGELGSSVQVCPPLACNLLSPTSFLGGEKRERCRGLLGDGLFVSVLGSGGLSSACACLQLSPSL